MKMIVEGPSSIPVGGKFQFLVLQNKCSVAVGAWNFVILVEASGTGRPSLVAVRMEYLFAYQFWYWELSMENLWGEERNHFFINFFLWGAFKVGGWELVRLVLCISLQL